MIVNRHRPKGGGVHRTEPQSVKPVRKQRSEVTKIVNYDC